MKGRRTDRSLRPSARFTRARSHTARAVRWILPVVWRTDPRLTLMLGLSVFVATMVPAALAVLVGLLVDALTSAAQGEGRLETAWIWLGAALVLMLASGVAGAFQRFAQLRLNDELELSISRQMLEQSARLDLSFFEDARGQDILQRAAKKPGALCLTFVLRFMKIASAVVQIVTLLGVMLWIEPWFTWLLVVVALPFMALQTWVADARYVADRAKTRVRRWGNYYRSRLTTPKAVASTRLMGLAPLMLERFERAIREVLEPMRATYRVELIGRIVIATGFLFAFAAVAGVLGQRVVAGAMPIGAFVAYWMAAWRFRASTQALVEQLSGELEAGLAVHNLLEFLDEAPGITQRGDVVLDGCRGAVALENVTFCYPGADRPALRDVSLVLEPGEVVALVGPNGAGKSTIAKLIARLYEVEEGRVTVDGLDVRDIAVDSLHAHIAFAFQEAVRFEATAGENLAFGDWQQLLGNSEQIQSAAERTGVASLIEGFPERYDTVLGRFFGTHELSGGQWRRLSIARALAKPAAIVIMDEPTESLDVHTEAELYSYIRALVQGRTTLLISHRLATVTLADRVVFVDEGRILESGSHEALVARGGRYAALWETYLDGTADLRLSSK